MTHDEASKDLARICKNCGEYKGRHKAYTLDCPEVDEEGRTIGYLNGKSFSEWIEEGGEL